MRKEDIVERVKSLLHAKDRTEQQEVILPEIDVVIEGRIPLWVGQNISDIITKEASDIAGLWQIYRDPDHFRKFDPERFRRSFGYSKEDIYQLSSDSFIKKRMTDFVALCRTACCSRWYNSLPCLIVFNEEGYKPIWTRIKLGENEATFIELVGEQVAKEFVFLQFAEKFNYNVGIPPSSPVEDLVKTTEPFATREHSIDENLLFILCAGLNLDGTSYSAQNMPDKYAPLLLDTRLSEVFPEEMRILKARYKEIFERGLSKGNIPRYFGGADRTDVFKYFAKAL